MGFKLDNGKCPDCGGEPTPQGRGYEETDDPDSLGDPCTHPCHDPEPSP
jgi:hypothetical protein